MKKTTNAARTWLIVTAGLVLVILVAVWFLLVSPVLAEASETNDEAQAQEDTNDLTRVAVAELKAQYEKIEEYQLLLDGLHGQIPVTPRYADLQRLVAAIADDHDVTVNSLTFGSAEQVEVATPQIATPQPDAEGDGESVPEPSPSPSSAPLTEEEAIEMASAVAASQGLYEISVGMELVGRYADVLEAVNALQTGEDRIVLVTAMDLTSDVDTTAQAGDAVATLEGLTFVVADPDALAEDPADADEEETAPEPLPQSTENPLTPSNG